LKLSVVAVGHRMPDWIGSGFKEYAKRMPREMPLTLIELKPETHRDEPGTNAATRVLEKEARRIEDTLPKGAMTIVLDEAGKTVTTPQLAQRMAQWRENGRDVAFVIGGADGTAARLKSGAEWLWSLSPLTLPHGLVRVVLAEQLYRAVSILNHHPYHRG
jgi:23S rRNA (pseudouridine1915-N3)-methyltransferase